MKFIVKFYQETDLSLLAGWSPLMQEEKCYRRTPWSAPPEGRPPGALPTTEAASAPLRFSVNEPARCSHHVPFDHRANLRRELGSFLTTVVPQ